MNKSQEKKLSRSSPKVHNRLLKQKSQEVIPAKMLVSAQKNQPAANKAVAVPLPILRKLTEEAS